jgi:hypothetical protein
MAAVVMSRLWEIGDIIDCIKGLGRHPMIRLSVPRKGTKDRIKFDLLTRPKGATVNEINRAVGHEAWSYINDTKRFAKRCGGTPHWTDGGGGDRRFWITRP